MHEIVKGANASLSALSDNADSVIISLSWSSPSGQGDADVSVLLLGEKGKVRSNGDFFFYNNPAAADGSVQLLGLTPTENGNEDRIQLDLSALPADIESAVIAASRHQRAQFGELENLRLSLTDGSGDAVLGFAITDASVESAFVFGEIYRRNDEWKFRAVGQGYDTGLAGLATDYGIEIEEDDDQEAEAETVEEAAESAGPQTTAETAPTAAEPAATPAQPRPEPPASAPARRLRTAKKKVTLPKAPKDTLARTTHGGPRGCSPPHR